MEADEGGQGGTDYPRSHKALTSVIVCAYDWVIISLGLHQQFVSFIASVNKTSCSRRSICLSPWAVTARDLSKKTPYLSLFSFPQLPRETGLSDGSALRETSCLTLLHAVDKGSISLRLSLYPEANKCQISVQSICIFRRRFTPGWACQCLCVVPARVVNRTNLMLHLPL